uniref:Uncharacterized protein LOC102806750 n=1 Tax=Saccoglossus kowalevskii TaxID=10224 RepID=A0ABM0MCG6_SACKO|nr:PREDICTED: uncharacterized protein LOC102806750 [Saccoglossus kowalevskii]
MERYDNPHIVRIYGVRNYMMVMEYVQYGSLNTYLSGLTDIKIEELFLTAIQVAEALEYLEDKSIVHGSICAKNVLVASKPGDSLFVKLADPMFGTKYYSLKSQSDARLSRVPWTSPEHLVGAKKVTLALDKFSYGVLCWEIFTKGREPFKDNRTEDIRHKYIIGQRPTLSILPSDMCDIIDACWHQDPKERPAFKSVLRDLRTLLNRLCNSDNLNDAKETYKRAWTRSVSETLYMDCSQSAHGENGDSGVGITLSSNRHDTVHPSDADSDIVNGDAHLSPGPLPAEGPVFDDIEEELEDYMIAPDALDIGDSIGNVSHLKPLCIEHLHLQDVYWLNGRDLYWLNGRGVYWLNGGDVHWLNDRDVYWLNGRDVYWLNGRDVYWLNDRDVYWLNGRDVHWLNDRDVYWLNSRDVYWLNSRDVYWLNGGDVHWLNDRDVYWLNDKDVYWLNDRDVYWLNDKNVYWLNDKDVYWLNDRDVDVYWLNGRDVYWLNGMDVYWLNGRDVYWLNGMDVYWFNDRDVYWLNGRDVYWLNGMDVYWLNGMDVHWLNGMDVHWLNGRDVYWLNGMDVHWLNGMDVHWLNGMDVYWLNGMDVHWLNGMDVY